MPARQVFFATNRIFDAQGNSFGSACGEPPDALRTGFVQVQAAANPVPEGRLLPGTMEVADAAPDSLLDTVDKWLKTAARDGSTPLLFVHGFNHDFAAAITRTAKLCAWLEEGGAPALLPLSFTWPSRGLGNLGGYRTDEAQTARSGLALAKLMGAIAKANQPRAVMHLLAHSMGVRMTRHAMQAIGPLLSGMALPVFDQAFLMAGDDEADVLAPPVAGDASAGGLRPIGDVAAHVTVGVNRDDGVVWLGSGKLAEGASRLGAAGPVAHHGLPANIPANAKVVDYSMVVLPPSAGQPQVYPGIEMNWVGHQYYRNAPLVRADLVAALVENGPPEGLVAAGPPHGRPRRRWGVPAPYGITEFADRLYPI